MPVKNPVRLRGSSRMKQLGMKLVQLWLDTHELAALKNLALEDGCTMANWLRKKIRDRAGIGLYDR